MTTPPPVAVYLHWPYCRRICPYCDFNVVRDRGRTEEQAAVVEAMLADLAEQALRTGPRRLVSVFFGGGTPSLTPPAAAGRLIETAARLFPPDGPIEVTLEANPTDAEAARYADFARAGVDRLSLGVQALDDASLAFLGRDHGAAEARRAAAAARGAFPRLSIDLIYARPGQTPQAWAAELSAALDLGPEHLSPYQLTVEQGTAFARAVGRGRWSPPDGDAAADLYDTTQAVLEGAGFHPYEVSNHARGEAARSRHNLAVWRGVEYLGVGPGAHGRVEIDGVRLATAAARRVPDYVARVATSGTGWEEAAPLSAEDAAEERVMLGLRLEEGVPLSAAAPLRAALEARAEPLAAAGLLEVAGDRLRATRSGRLLLDRITRDLLS